MIHTQRQRMGGESEQAKRYYFTIGFLGEFEKLQILH